MATIYDIETAEYISEGLQGSDVCDEAIRAARLIAKERDRPVVLDDDDGVWIVDPSGLCEPAGKEWE